MTLNSMIPVYKKEAAVISDDSLTQSRIMTLVSKAFAAGAASMITVKGSKTIDVNKDLNEDLSDYYLEKNFPQLFEYILITIQNCIGPESKLKLNYSEIIRGDVKNIMKTVYDMGLVNGVTIGQSQKLLAAYSKNREMIENGEY